MTLDESTTVPSERFVVLFVCLFFLLYILKYTLVQFIIIY